MEEDWSGQMGFQHTSSGLKSEELAEKKVAESAVNTASMFNASHEGRLGRCYDSGWDPILSLTQSENFGASLMASHGHFANPMYPGVTEDMGMRATSQFMQHCSSDDTNAVEMLPKLSAFGGGSFSGMLHPYGLPSSAANKTNIIEKAPVDQMQSKEKSLDSSPIGKRKKLSNLQNAEGDIQRNASDDNSDEKDMGGKKQKIEENDSSDQGNKPRSGRRKDNSPDGEASKGDYVHVRARKGQATNSHSLAERVRREKINDRMKLLQELVPGCNKITGKAVMLDEIINYVQSLQHQVEFLSMKLATVNPEADFNVEQILSKEILHSRGSNAPILGLAPGMSSAHLCATDIHQGPFSGISRTASPFHSVPPSIKGMWDAELQNLLQMGFEPNPPISGLGPNGSSKR